jgi:hypothetical protein
VTSIEKVNLIGEGKTGLKIDLNGSAKEYE